MFLHVFMNKLKKKVNSHKRGGGGRLAEWTTGHSHLKFMSPRVILRGAKALTSQAPFYNEGTLQTVHCRCRDFHFLKRKKKLNLYGNRSLYKHSPLTPLHYVLLLLQLHDRWYNTTAFSLSREASFFIRQAAWSKNASCNNASLEAKLWGRDIKVGQGFFQPQGDIYWRRISWLYPRHTEGIKYCLRRRDTETWSSTLIYSTFITLIFIFPLDHDN